MPLEKAARMNRMRTALAVTSLLLMLTLAAIPLSADTSVEPGRQLIEGSSSMVITSWQDGGPSVDHARVVRLLQYHGDEFSCRETSRSDFTPEIGERVPSDVASERLPESVGNALPRYEGYAWRRVGDSVVLIAIASNSFQDIFHEVLCPTTDG